MFQIGSAAVQENLHASSKIVNYSNAFFCEDLPDFVGIAVFCSPFV